MPQSTVGKIGMATLIMMVSIFLSRVLGVVRESTIAAVSGAGMDVGAYRMAFVLPEILNHILASGFFSVTFIPIFSRYLADGDEEGGWRIFSIILTTFGLLLAGLIILCMAFTPQIVALLAAGRKDPEFLAMAVRMTRITLPAQFFFFTGGMLMAVQFAREHFAIPALAPLVYNLGIIAGGLVLGPWLGVEGFAWGALTGAFLGNFLIQIMGACKVGLRIRPSFNVSHPDLLRYVLLTLPLMLGLTMTFSTEIFSKFFGSFLPPGSIAWIDYALRIMFMLVGFFGQAIGVASYPYLASFAAENRIDELNRIFNTTLQYLALVLPISILVLVLRHEIIRVLFERGQFTTSDTEMTALALSGLMVGAVAFAAQTIVNRGFYALQNTLLPAAYSTIAVIFSLPFYWMGLKTMGVLGVGLAISFSAIIQSVILFIIWNRRSNNEGRGSVYRTYLKTVMATMPLGGILWIGHRFLAMRINIETFQGSLGVIVAESALFLLLMALGGWLFKAEAIRFVWRRLIGRFRPPTGNG